LRNSLRRDEQKYRDELLPPLTEPSAELLAQSALFLVLRDQPPSTHTATPWTRLASRRFGGDIDTRTVSFETGTGAVVSLRIRRHPNGGLFDVAVQPMPGSTMPVKFRGISASLTSPTSLSATIADTVSHATVVPQAHGAAGAERLHIFSGPHAATVLCRAPAWAEELSADAHSLARGALRAPMPSLVVDVRVTIGERVEKGQVVVVLESMKTETVLRAPGDGVVKVVGCAKGEMVEEGRELVEIEESGEA
jgi:3-methylcrotonyl-CoA carboxylase alpha subunit